MPMQIIFLLFALLFPTAANAVGFQNFQPGTSGVYRFPLCSSTYAQVSSDTVFYCPFAIDQNCVIPLSTWTKVGSGVSYVQASRGSRWGSELQGLSAPNYLSATAAIITALQSAGAAYTFEVDFYFGGTGSATNTVALIQDVANASLINSGNVATFKWRNVGAFSCGNNSIVLSTHHFIKATTDGLLNSNIYIDGTAFNFVTAMGSLAGSNHAVLTSAYGSSNLGTSSSFWDFRIRNVYDNTGTRTTDTALGAYHNQPGLGLGLDL